MVIGLTGGIASGKSVVSGMLAGRGAPVIDADKLGHEAYLPGTACFDEVVSAFGSDIVAPDGSIDRKALGARVFGDPAQRKRLEAIVWPAIKRLAAARIESLRAERVPVAVLEAAVLFEAEWTDLADAVWVVVVDPAIARARIVARNGLTPAQADARLAAQLANEERIRRADIVIENGGTLDELRAHVDDAWRSLPARAAAAEGA